MTMKTAASDIDISWQSISFALISAAILLIPDVYAGAQESAVGNYICYIADNFTGNAGRGIATIGISVIGTLASLGRVTWTQAIIAGIGVAVLFGAGQVVASLGGGICTV